MKHLAPQLDLPGTEAVFNLIGEIMERQPVKESVRVDTQTLDLFQGQQSLVQSASAQNNPIAIDF